MEKQQVEPQMRQPGGNEQGRKLGQMRFLPYWKKCFENASSTGGIKVDFQHFPLIFASLNGSVSIWYICKAYLCGRGWQPRFASVIFFFFFFSCSIDLCTKGQSTQEFLLINLRYKKNAVVKRQLLGYLNFSSFSLYSPLSCLLLSLH